MKVVVIGGTGLIGTKLVNHLLQHGHEAVAASPSTGVNALTGEGLASALEGATVVVDVSNSPSTEAKVAMDFFARSTRNLLEAETGAGIHHHVLLSPVGTERLSDSGYFRAKIVQEYLVSQGSIPFSIVHSTQFFELMMNLVDGSAESVRVAPVLCRPMAADDVVRILARVAVGMPVHRVIEAAGPEEFRLDQIIRETLQDGEDRRQVIADPEARYLGAHLEERTLLPEEGARVGEIRAG